MTWWTGERIEVGCTIDLEQTPESLHAYVDLDGVEPEVGDTVIIHDAPTVIAFGKSEVHRRRATVIRAGSLKRHWTKITAYLELTELYEVGFSTGGI